MLDSTANKEKKMHENANRHFVGELVSDIRPDVTTVVVHGRTWQLGRWVPVITEILPNVVWTDLWGSGYHSITDGLHESETLTWGGESIEVEKLPIVSHSGVRQSFPGWVIIGALDGRKSHVLWYGIELRQGVNAPDYSSRGLCGRWAPHTGGTDAKLFMGMSSSCRDCQQEVKKLVNEL